MTYVLIEAWREMNRKYPDAKLLLAKFAAMAGLEIELQRLEGQDVITKLRECRNYMCHRDRREYWDHGRLAPVGHLQEILQLMNRFGIVLHAALDDLAAESTDRRGSMA